MTRESAASQDLPDWASQPWIYCSTGPLQGQVYTLEQWETKARLKLGSHTSGFPRTSQWFFPGEQALGPQSGQPLRGDDPNEPNEPNGDHSVHSVQSDHDTDDPNPMLPSAAEKAPAKATVVPRSAAVPEGPGTPAEERP